LGTPTGIRSSVSAGVSGTSGVPKPSGSVTGSDSELLGGGGNAGGGKALALTLAFAFAFAFAFTFAFALPFALPFALAFGKGAGWGKAIDDDDKDVATAIKASRLPAAGRFIVSHRAAPRNEGGK